jgi:PhnB protein
MRQALKHGAVLEMEVDDMPYGDRQGGVKAQHGNIWRISQRNVHEPYTPQGNARDLILPCDRCYNT